MPMALSRRDRDARDSVLRVRSSRGRGLSRVTREA